MVIIHEFNESFWNFALDISQGRQIINRKMIEAGLRFDRGDKNMYVEQIGILGELIARDYLFSKEIHFVYSPLIQQAPAKEADIIVDGVRFDVKTSVWDERYDNVLVNAEAHQKGRGVIDWYWFVVIDFNMGTTARSFRVPYSQVDLWPSKVFKYTEAYYSPIKELYHDGRI